MVRLCRGVSVAAGVRGAALKGLRAPGHLVKLLVNALRGVLWLGMPPDML